MKKTTIRIIAIILFLITVIACVFFFSPSFWRGVEYNPTAVRIFLISVIAITLGGGMLLLIKTKNK